jgi:hypothetical protein
MSGGSQFPPPGRDGGHGPDPKKEIPYTTLPGLVTRRQNPTPSCAERLAANVLTARVPNLWVRCKPADAAQREEDAARGHFIKQKALAKANASCALK